MDVLSDLRYAVRVLARTPGLTFLVLLNLTLGIAGSTSIFSLLHGVVLAPLPFAEPDRLVRLCELHETTKSFCVASVPDLADLAERSHSFEKIGAGRLWPLVLRTPEGPQGITGALVTPGLQETLRVRPALGRLIEESDLGTGKAPVVVLSDGFWQSWSGRDPKVLGRTLSLDNEPYTVVGVLPRVAIPEMGNAKVWLPLPFDPRDEENRAWRGFIGVGRLKPGIDLRSAQIELEGLVGQLRQEHPEAFKDWGIRAVSLREQLVGSVRSTLILFLGAVGLVLLIACTNVANLLLVRATGRQREMALRVSMGASRGRLIRQIMGESLLLAAGGGAAGLVLAYWAVRALLPLAPQDIPRLAEVSINGWVLAFSILITFLSSLLSGLWPAFRAVRVDLTRDLKEGASSALGAAGNRARGLLVPAEVALALILLIGAGLLTRSLAAGRAWNGGFEHEHLLSLWLLPLDSKYPDANRVSAFYQRAEEAVAELPGVLSVGAASAGPLFGGRETEDFVAEGGNDRPLTVRWYEVGPRYFATLGLPVLQGRPLNDQDGAGAPRVALVNETFAKRLWPGKNPIGQRVRGQQEHKELLQVVGVVPDVKPLNPGGEAEPEIYWPFAQAPRWATYLVVRTRSDPLSLAGDVRRKLLTLDPDLDIEQMATFGELRDKKLSGSRFQATLVNLFALVALAMMIGGTYGVLSHAVAQQTREIGLRMALGAQRRDVLLQVIGRALRLVCAGILAGLIGAVALARLFRGLLYGVAPTDPATFLGMTALLLAVTVLASFIPARRATRIDPMIAIRQG